jgi:antitoxin component YwqK of YwqJK toxin-antitoxin module
LAGCRNYFPKIQEAACYRFFGIFVTMKITCIVFVCLLCIAGWLPSSAQDFRVFKGDTINRTDAKGLKQGVWKRFYDNDQLFSESVFKNGKAVGTTKTWYKTGEIQGILVHDKDGKTSRMNSYWPNGKRKAIGKYVNQEKDSVWTFFNEQDTLTSVESYKLGTPHGTWKVYYPNGKLSEETTWVDGKKHGPFRNYFSTGGIKTSGTYRFDTFNGEMIMYHLNGKPFSKGTYVDGLRQGTWTYFSETGVKDSTQVFENGSLRE